jgi:phosphoenolpyruvate-protein phosphotransferase (PTS system enzyme I)
MATATKNPMRQGVPVSPGVVVARAYCLDSALLRREPRHLDPTALPAEINRFAGACAAAIHELDGLIARVTQQLGPEEAAIFSAHRSLLRDPVLTGKVKAAILNRQVDARTALQDVLDEYSVMFSHIQDEYLRERVADVRDVIGRILTHLDRPTEPSALSPDEPVVIVAMEILPSHTMMFNRLKVAGIMTETGGATGHAAILARSLGIPAVSGLDGILKEVQNGDLVALDGREGHVYLNPGPEVEAAYRKLQREYVDLRDRLIENLEKKSVTSDGIPIELLANVNGPADAAMAARVGAAGVGLYRTEYLFLTHPSVPDEEEQLAAYRAVLEASPNRRATIRTLDLGGDKHLPYLGTQSEANPFLGWRSIRLISAHPELFQTQLRAILRAGTFGDVRLLFPMISTLEEVQQIKSMVDRTRRELARAGIAYGENIPLGVMLEVPAAALSVDALLEEVDFVSIGSNDLIQYVMAADRDNPKVAHLCDPVSPPILRLLHQVIQACNKHGKPVTLCGEMAGRPRCFLPLFGMGLHSLSMSPAFVPPLKELIRRSTQTIARDVLDHVLKMKKVNEIRDYLTVQTRQVWPDVTLLETRE